MNGLSFVDSNVLVYAFDADSPVKQERSQDLLFRNPIRYAVSAQVLGEFYVTVTRKLKPPTPARDAAAVVDDVARSRVVGLDAALVRRAIQTAREHQLSYWDALIVEAAVAGGCVRILSEDLTHGQTIRGVEIVNPFTSESTS